ncbi:hypothetical protein, partial [Selenomonas montiformis]|uniref:hypothetical protein n=1 Tax=Selenomonas montiformis TaxID=2652285 RepID=UPI0019D593AF
PTPCQEKYSAIRHPRSALGKKCLQHLLHKGSPGVQLIIAIRALNFLVKIFVLMAAFMYNVKR